MHGYLKSMIYETKARDCGDHACVPKVKGAYTLGPDSERWVSSGKATASTPVVWSGNPARSCKARNWLSCPPFDFRKQSLPNRYWMKPTERDLQIL